MGAHHAGDPQPGQEGCRLPMAVRNAGPKPLASWSAAITPGHVGRCPGLVDEHQTIRIEIELASNQSQRRFRMSGRFCSAACAVFF
jgi:hypothetical protein